MSRWLFAVSAACLYFATPALAQDEDDDPRRVSRMQRNHSDRPLSLPKDLFAVWGTLGGGQLTEEFAYVSLGAGAEYGIDDNTEVGIELLRLSLSGEKTSGFGDPRLSLLYRMSKGVFEIGGRGSITIPLKDAFTFAIALPMLLRFAPIARLDIIPEVRAIAVTGWRFASTTTALFRFQLGNAVSIGPLATVTAPDFRNADFYAHVGGRFTYTIGKNNGGDADLSISALSPALKLAGNIPVDPSPDRYFSVLVEVRVFIEDTIDSPFEEEL